MVVSVKVDELSLVFLPNPPDTLEKWEKQANSARMDIDQLLGLTDVFGERIRLQQGWAGYNNVIRYGDDVVNMAVAYNSSQPNMGIYVHFSATAFGRYLAARKMTTPDVVRRFAEITNDGDDGEAHVSRIDVAQDWIDEGLSVNDIYVNLATNKWHMVDKNERLVKSQINTVTTNDVVNTMYVGSKKKGTRLLMRIYNKKLEQINNAKRANYYVQALHCKDWVRFEASYRQQYAHQIGAELMKIKGDTELSNFLFGVFVEKFRFVDFWDDQTNITKIMLAYADSAIPILDGRKTQEQGLEVSIRYIVEGSGLMPTMYKIREYYGDEGLADFVKYLNDNLHVFEPNADARNDIYRNKSEYQSRKVYPWRELGILKGNDSNDN